MDPERMVEVKAMLQVILILAALMGLIGLFVNAGRKLFLWFGPLLPGMGPLPFGMIYGAAVTAVMVLFVLSRIPDSPIPRVVFLVDHYALGFAIYVMLFVNLADLVLFLARLCRLLPTPLPQGAAVAAGTAAMLFAIVLSVYGVVHASRIQTKSYVAVLQADGVNLETAKMDSMKIALISDLHLGYVVDENHVKKIVAAVNAAEADLVCIAGDIFDGDITSVKNPAVLQGLLREIHAPLGVYACLGNHDAGTGYEGMLDFLDKAQIHLLQDEQVLIDNRLILAGRKDSGPIGGQGRKRTALEENEETEGLPRIVLDHNPINADEYTSSTDLILCGHTHQGQLFPFNLAVKAALKLDYGYYRQSASGPQTIVTSGAGTWGPPQRVGTDNEVVVIEVVFPLQKKEMNDR